MIRTIQAACWRFRVWRIKRQASARVRELRAKHDAAAKAHKPRKHIWKALRDAQNEGLRQ